MAKKLLSEAAVRRFATLANLSPINEMSSMYEDEEEMGEMPPEEEMPPMGEEPLMEEEEEIMETLEGINYIPEKKDIVEEVARRVAKRLLKAKRAQADLNEALGNQKNKKK